MTGMARSHTLDQELARQGELSLTDLKRRYGEITGKALPKHFRRDLAVLVVGHAMQCKTLGGFDRDTRRAIDALVAGIVPAGTAKPKAKNRKLRIGTRLIREWQGRVYEVAVTDAGYSWNGRSFGSLTEIARTITGTNWNGWVFFGVKTPKPSDPKVMAKRRGRLSRDRLLTTGEGMAIIHNQRTQSRQGIGG